MHTIAISIRLVLIGLVVALLAGCPGSSAPEGSMPPVEVGESAEIAWVKSWDAALVRAQAEQKPIAAVFYADWCIWCKRLEETTLSDGAVASFLAEQAVAIRLDVDGDGEAVSEQFNVDGLPTVVFVNPDGSERGRIPGYLPPEGFLERARPLIG